MTRARGRPPKRRLSGADVVNTASTRPSLRQSKRAKRLSITSANDQTHKQSRYFEHDSTSSRENSELSDDGSVFEENELLPTASTGAASSSSEYGTDADDVTTSRTDRRKGQTAKTRVSAKGKELWRYGVKSALEPGQEVFIKLPKARGAGKVPYQDGTLHPNTFLFLGDLKLNNDREWLKVHDADFRQAQSDFSSFVEELTEKLLEKDDTLPELPVKDIVFRIYRDVRFSKDQTPYKTYFSAAWSRTGRKGPYAAYYIQIAPKSSFIGGGLWHPEASSLNRLRSAVDTDARSLKQVLMRSDIRGTFLGGVTQDEKKVVKAFASHNSENALKRKPKGYEDNHPNIDLLRLKNYTIGRELTDEEVLNASGLDNIANMYVNPRGVLRQNQGDESVFELKCS